MTLASLRQAWTICALAIAMPALIGCGDAAVAPQADGAPAADAAPVRIRVVDGVNIDVRDVPLLMAFDALSTRGYRVEPTYIAGNTLLAEALARGDAEVGIINNHTAWSAVANGANIRSVSEFTLYTGAVVAHTGIKSCRDLHRRPVGVPVTTGFAPLLFHLFLRTECPGVEPELLVMAESSSRTSALLSGRLDASMVPGEEVYKLQAVAPGRFHPLVLTRRAIRASASTASRSTTRGRSDIPPR